MKHLTFLENTLLLDDEAANLLIAYAAALLNAGKADALDVHVVDSTGRPSDVRLLVPAGAPLMAQDAESIFPEPDNAAAIEYMSARIRALTTRVAVSPEHSDEPSAELDL